MDLSNFGALALAMLVLAAIPSLSVLAVTSRALSSGFRHGAAVSAGVVAGDIIFILVALFGLNVLINMAPGWATLLKYLAAAYLFWMAWTVWIARRQSPAPAEDQGKSSIMASATAGLLLTLGDQKAVLFYLGFFPAFVDVEHMTSMDTLLIVLITIICVGGVKLVYAWLVSRGRQLWQNSRANQISTALNSLAAGILAMAAVLVILRY